MGLAHGLSLSEQVCRKNREGCNFAHRGAEETREKCLPGEIDRARERERASEREREREREIERKREREREADAETHTAEESERAFDFVTHPPSPRTSPAHSSPSAGMIPPPPPPPVGTGVPRS